MEQTVRNISGHADMWLRRYVASQAGAARLVCFPHAGGSASFYRPVALSHAPGADVVVLQYPGRQDRRREPFVTSIEQYADLIAGALATMPPKPTVYFGHSMGAIIAFEVAHRLEDESMSLIVSGRGAPSTSRDENVHRRDDHGILAEIARLNGTDSAMLADDEILRMTLPAIRNDYRAVETYEPTDRMVHCPITVLIGQDDQKATVAEADRWCEHTSGEFRIRRFRGGHFYLTTQQAEVNSEIATELARVARAGRQAHNPRRREPAAPADRRR
jgi:surfactin synthase thioesterase subunit